MHDQKQAEHERFLEAQRLAELNLGRCHGPCKTIKPLSEMLSVMFRNTLATAICTSCLEHVNLTASMLPEGINIKLLQKSSIVLIGK